MVPGTYRVTIVGAGGDGAEYTSGMTLEGQTIYGPCYAARGSGASGALLIGTFTLASADTLKILQGVAAVNSYVKSNKSTSILNVIAKAGTSGYGTTVPGIYGGTKGTVSASTKTGLTLESSADGENGSAKCNGPSYKAVGSWYYGNASYPATMAPGGYANASYPYGGGKGWKDNVETTLTQRGYVKIVRIA